MARPPSRFPTELELEILKIVWRDSKATVRQVRDAIVGFRDLAYTSVMTIMCIMTRKGYLKRKKRGKCFVYEALVTQKETTRGMMGDLVTRLFRGSTAAAMVNLLETGDVEGEDLDELRTMIDERAG